MADTLTGRVLATDCLPLLQLAPELEGTGSWALPSSGNEDQLVV